MTNVLYTDAWVTLTIDTTLRLVRYERSNVPYAGKHDLEKSYAAVGEAFLQVPMGMNLLLDLRLAPPRNDEMFEAKATEALDRLLKKFTRHATLVRTAVGKLQSLRLANQRNDAPHVFDNEATALAYLRG